MTGVRQYVLKGIINNSVLVIIKMGMVKKKEKDIQAIAKFSFIF